LNHKPQQGLILKSSIYFLVADATSDFIRGFVCWSFGLSVSPSVISELKSVKMMALGICVGVGVGV